MHTDFLTLAQWLSPSYPLGSFAYSHGLEAAVAEGAVCNAASLHDWLADVLQHGAGQSDALFLAAAYRAPSSGALSFIDASCRAFAPSAERLMETDLQGAAFCRTTSAVWQLGLPPLTLPVAIGRAAGLLNLPLLPTLELYLQAFASNLIGAAQRLMPLGQTQAQALIHACADQYRAVALAAEDGDLDRLGATAFLADMASAHHETQGSRIFRT